MQVSCAFSAVIACGHCVVPQNIHTHPLDRHWKFQRGRGCQKPKFLKINMKLDWNVQIGEGGGGDTRIFSGNTHQSFDKNLSDFFSSKFWAVYASYFR